MSLSWTDARVAELLATDACVAVVCGENCATAMSPARDVYVGLHVVSMRARLPLLLTVCPVLMDRYALELTGVVMHIRTALLHSFRRDFRSHMARLGPWQPMPFRCSRGAVGGRLLHMDATAVYASTLVEFVPTPMHGVLRAAWGVADLDCPCGRPAFVPTMDFAVAVCAACGEQQGLGL